MKKLLIGMLVLLLCTGCAAQETMETIGDVYAPGENPTREVVLNLPEDAAASASGGSQAGQLYLCEDYEIVVEVLQGGNVEETVRTLTGMPSERVTVLKTRQEDCDRFDFTWATLGENGEQVGRCAILDDGCSHYCVSVLADADKAGNLRQSWQTLFDSFSVSSY